ncbi:hypothetical protein C8F04DRAFT_1130047 [Mycena alexandri]|uniref:Secreted protein n=1 Tax=Mycena alexandri TaxID=1745969 RepID=A0AAD6WXN2_9AGAR|nr:hypothetical protein C8F04DRAFT_1130047 [Mycena alexandri]
MYTYVACCLLLRPVTIFHCNQVLCLCARLCYHTSSSSLETYPSFSCFPPILAIFLPRWPSGMGDRRKLRYVGIKDSGPPLIAREQLGHRGMSSSASLFFQPSYITWGLVPPFQVLSLSPSSVQCNVLQHI